jgi:hypothetical protein
MYRRRRRRRRKKEKKKKRKTRELRERKRKKKKKTARGIPWYSFESRLFKKGEANRMKRIVSSTLCPTVCV